MLGSSPEWKTHFNGLCDYFYIFILKSIKLLKPGGELVFICPDYWLSTSHAAALRQFMLENGGFSDIVRFHESPLFEGVSSSLMIFRYVKTVRPANIHIVQIQGQANLGKSASSFAERIAQAKRFSIQQFSTGSAWTIAEQSEMRRAIFLEKTCAHHKQGSSPLAAPYATIGDVCDIGNGMVSGLDKAFQTRIGPQHTLEETAGSIRVAKAKHLKPYRVTQLTDYIFVRGIQDEAAFMQRFPNFYAALQPSRDALKKRYDYRRELPYWQRAFPRSYPLFSSAAPRILVPCKERITNKDCLRFAIAEQGVYPTQDVTALFKKPDTRESLEYITAYLNQPSVFHWIKLKGTMKGGVAEFSEKPLASIPFRHINWNNPDEVMVHHGITENVKQYMRAGESSCLDNINDLFATLGV